MSDKFCFGARSSLVFVGNRRASTLDLVGSDGKTLRQKYVVGEPHPCAAGSAEDMKQQGFVGVYVRQTGTLYRLPGSGRTIRLKF